jgi:hypothetical protein
MVLMMKNIVKVSVGGGFIRFELFIEKEKKNVKYYQSIEKYYSFDIKFSEVIKPLKYT